MLVDKKILAGGIAMVIVGTIIMINLNAAMPAGQSGMTEEEIIDLMTKQQENQDMTAFAGILFQISCSNSDSQKTSQRVTIEK